MLGALYEIQVALRRVRAENISPPFRAKGGNLGFSGTARQLGGVPDATQAKNSPFHHPKRLE